MAGPPPALWRGSWGSTRWRPRSGPRGRRRRWPATARDRAGSPSRATASTTPPPPPRPPLAGHPAQHPAEPVLGLRLQRGGRARRGRCPLPRVRAAPLPDAGERGDELQLGHGDRERAAAAAGQAVIPIRPAMPDDPGPVGRGIPSPASTRVLAFTTGSY